MVNICRLQQHPFLQKHIGMNDYMKEIDKEYPGYHWKKNKGYPTVEHRAAIAQYGVSPYHRKSFNLLGDSQLSFEFV